MDRIGTLLEFERARLRAFVAGDLATAEKMHRADYQLVTPRGALLSLAEYFEEMRSGHIRYVSWEPADMVGRLFAEVAVIRYRSTIEMMVDGTPIPRFQCRHTGVYEEAGGGWQALMSHATAVQ